MAGFLGVLWGLFSVYLILLAYTSPNLERVKDPQPPQLPGEKCIFRRKLEGGSRGTLWGRGVAIVFSCSRRFRKGFLSVEMLKKSDYVLFWYNGSFEGWMSSSCLFVKKVLSVALLKILTKDGLWTVRIIDPGACTTNFIGFRVIVYRPVR